MNTMLLHFGKLNVNFFCQRNEETDKKIFFKYLLINF